jgi:hypothetical protein
MSRTSRCRICVRCLSIESSSSAKLIDMSWRTAGLWTVSRVCRSRCTRSTRLRTDRAQRFGRAGDQVLHGAGNCDSSRSSLSRRLHLINSPARTGVRQDRLCDVPRQCERLRAVAYGSSRHRSLECFRIWMTARSVSLAKVCKRQTIRAAVQRFASWGRAVDLRDILHRHASSVAYMRRRESRGFS